MNISNNVLVNSQNIETNIEKKMKRNRSSVSPTSDKRIQSRLSPDDDRGESGDVNDAAVDKGRVRREDQNRGFRSGSLFSSDHDFHPAGLVSESANETYPWH